MKVSLKVAFNLLDGRMSTNMDDVTSMLAYIYCNEHISTIGLSHAFGGLKEANPKWFSDGVARINEIKADYETNSFGELMTILDADFSEETITLEIL